MTEADPRISEIPGLAEIGIEDLSALGRGELILVPREDGYFAGGGAHFIHLFIEGKEHKEVFHRLMTQFTVTGWAHGFLKKEVFAPSAPSRCRLVVLKERHFVDGTRDLAHVIEVATGLGCTLLDAEKMCALRFHVKSTAIDQFGVRQLIIPIFSEKREDTAPLFFIDMHDTENRYVNASYEQLEEIVETDVGFVFVAPF